MRKIRGNFGSEKKRKERRRGLRNFWRTMRWSFWICSPRAALLP
jgi:hypothetical protein